MTVEAAACGDEDQLTLQFDMNPLPPNQQTLHVGHFRFTSTGMFNIFLSSGSGAAGVDRLDELTGVAPLMFKAF